MHQKPLKVFSSLLPDVVSPPNLIEAQINSYQLFWERDLKDLFEEFSPIFDYTGQDLALTFGDYYLDESKVDEKKAKENGLSYEAPLRCKVRLQNKKTKEIKEQEVYLGDFPLMTDRGTFIVNGVERVIVSQLIRSSGVYFSAGMLRGKKLFSAKLIPSRGAWLEF